MHISFAGAGRVGASLCREFFSSGHSIDMIVTPTGRSGMSLAAQTGAKWSSVPDFPQFTDIIIVAIPDRSLETFLNNLKCGNHTIVVHTAGSYGLDIFPPRIRKKGVFYPLQTFSECRKIDFSEVPFLLEAGDDNTASILKELASEISRNVSFIDAERRRLLHLAAVFVCNFVNHMLTAGCQVAMKAGFSTSILEPLIKETVSKALEAGPQNSQTGPAARNDLKTIEKHLELLSAEPGLQRLYHAVTNSITDYYKNGKSD